METGRLGLSRIPHIGRDRDILEGVHPLLARQIIEDYSITEGLCLDIGAGSGKLGIELAWKTGLWVVLVDVSRHAATSASEAIQKVDMVGRAFVVRADVQQRHLYSAWTDASLGKSHRTDFSADILDRIDEVFPAGG